MTSTAQPSSRSRPRHRPRSRRRLDGDRGGFGRAVSDGLIVAQRNLMRVPRIPELAIFAILQSIMFVLLFAFVFGGAIPLPGYTDRMPTAST